MGTSRSEKDDDEAMPASDQYRDLLRETSAYKWLVATLRREATLSRGTPDLMEAIREEIFSALPSAPKVSRRQPSQPYKATFELDWDPWEFVKEQQYSETIEKALENAVTLTGCPNDAQALTTKAYLRQTWPATGSQVMQLVKDLVQKPKGHVVNTTLPDGTEIGIGASQSEIPRRKVIVKAVGVADSVTEIAQQFAWLGAALRSSSFDSGVAVCSPFVQNTRVGSTTAQFQSRLVELSCNIDFPIQLLANEEALPGQCWHGMFRNPVMVQGFPISTKHAHELGLEMPLNMIAKLTAADYANEFDSRVFIKGYSAMLVATRVAKDLMIWHYLYNRSGKWISYLDNHIPKSDDISLLQLDSSRHVVGWSSDCSYYAGAKDAQYSIDGTGLRKPRPGGLLEKLNVSGGKWLSVGMSIAVGVRDVPSHLPRNGYIPSLKLLHTKYVVLWDEAVKKGWLVNGTSALLHLVRASLDISATDSFASRFLFDPSKMHNASEYNPRSAIEVLINEENMRLPIYPGEIEASEEEEKKQRGHEIEESTTLKSKKNSYLFVDLVKEHYNILFHIIEHQTRAAGENGIKIKVRVRKHLEGWDFLDVAKGRDFHPRVATLNALGYGWVDFVRSIGAVTLLGRGFGDIIKPTEFPGMCPRWNSLPPARYYLAASVVDLKEIMSEFGSKWLDPPEPVHGLVWHCPGDVVATCQCSGGRFRRLFKNHNDPVQVFYPRKWHQSLCLGEPGRLADAGAVVFGHNIGWKYRWKEDGNDDLEECHDPVDLPEDEDQEWPTLVDSSAESSVLADKQSVSSGVSQNYKNSERTTATSFSTGSDTHSPQLLTRKNYKVSHSSIRRPAQAQSLGDNRSRRPAHVQSLGQIEPRRQAEEQNLGHNIPRQLRHENRRLRDRYVGEEQ
ncbi:hypothetical protein BU16DRAFT_462498 [Lophium mytilinum]|uniref:Uncharacterized protein n=1 Tax=Lophium mytilinum TaxID=390894 RepID=A0A6A6QR45_9PEZI|nr:hypothetical protein BU16DRAFT_462498 [Lophium mytilinum]